MKKEEIISGFHYKTIEKTKQILEKVDKITGPQAEFK